MYTQNEIEAIFRTLTLLEVVLDENPLEYGPRRLSNKIAEARKMLSQTERLFLEVAGNIQKCKSAHRSAETLLTLSKKELMANDPETRAGRNLATQDAIASVKLQPQVAEVDRLAAALQDLTAVVAVIKAKRADLKDIQSRIRDQMKLCSEEIGLGVHWGSKLPPGSPSVSLDGGGDSNTTFNDLRDLFHGTEVHDLPEKVSEPAEPEPAEPEPAEPEPAELLLPDSDGQHLNADPTGLSDSSADVLLAGILDSPKPEPRLTKKELDIDAILSGFDF